VLPKQRRGLYLKMKIDNKAQHFVLKYCYRKEMGVGKRSALHSASSFKYHFLLCNCYGQPYENEHIVFIVSP